MSTQLVFGVAGAVVGNMIAPGIGGSIGFAVGSAVGSLVDPPKSEGPRLHDLTLQRSAYGQSIPIVWGTGRLAGNVIDQTDLQEHSQKSGGKGGPQVTNYTYSASFDILLCQTPVFGEPAIQGVSRIWADGRLIWTLESGVDIPCTVYDGADDQMPDPTFEAVHSPDPVPAYRGYAHAVFTDHSLTDYGNRIPQFEFEVYTGSGTGDIPWRVSTYERIHGASNDQGVAVNEDGTHTLNYINPSGGEDTPVYRTVEVRQTDAAGTLVSSDVYSLSTWNGMYVFYAVPCQNNPRITEITPASAGAGGDFGSWYLDNGVVAHPISGGGDATAIYSRPAYYDGYVYATGGGATALRRYPSPLGVTSGNHDHAVVLPHADAPNWPVAVDEDGFVYVFYAGGGAYPKELRKYSADLLTLIAVYAPGVCPDLGGAGFAVWNGMVCFESIDGGGQHYASVYLINPAGFELLGEMAVSNTLTHGGFTSLGNGLVSVPDGIISLVPPNPGGPIDLATIVGNISDMTQATGQYDVTELEDIPVRWFAMASQMTAKNAIGSLRQAFFFDAVESDDQIKFRLRERDAVFSIPDDDLCAHVYGEDPGTPLKTLRKKELDLPRAVSFSYINVDADYQVGVESSRRQVTRSESDVTVQVPVGFTAEEAAQRCETLQASEWIEREGFEWYTSRKWAKLEPCDIGTVRGRVIRIQTRTEQPDGVIKWTGALADPSIYTQTTTGSGVGGFVAQEPPPPPQLTVLEVLDIPLITDPARQNVYEAAMAGAERPAWRGASLQRSVDGGTTYSELVNVLDPDIIGTVDDALGNFLGGNVLDEVNIVHVTIGAGGGELSSTTYEGVLNGVNEFLLGSEILQARDAVLVTGSTYTLTGLLRGRRGTEWAMVTHVVGERFIALPASELSYQTTDVGVTRKYKAVTNGSTLASATAEDVTLRGVSLTPYSPVLPGAGTNAAGDWILQWVRRARVNGAWLNFTDVPLDEPSEQYRVTLWTDAQYLTVAATIDCTTITTTVTAAQQTTIFGSPQSELFWSVAQIGRLGPGYDTLGRAPTVATPPPSAPPAGTDVPPMGEQWHPEYVFAGSTHAELNANWLLSNYGTSWAWAYVVASASNVINIFTSTLTDGHYIVNVFAGSGVGPPGVMVPWAPTIMLGPVLHSDHPMVSIPLPYPDNDSV